MISLKEKQNQDLIRHYLKNYQYYKQQEEINEHFYYLIDLEMFEKYLVDDSHKRFYHYFLEGLSKKEMAEIENLSMRQIERKIKSLVEELSIYLMWID